MNKSTLFKKAHQIAKATVAQVGNYMVAFKLALIEVYQSLKPSVESKLLDMGLKIWTRKGRRIYLNEKVWDYFNLDYSKFVNRSCQREVFGYTHPTKVYFDCDSKEFVGIKLNNIAEYQH